MHACGGAIPRASARNKHTYFITFELYSLSPYVTCLLQCLQKLITRSISGVLFVQQEGGDVGQGLKDKSPSTDSLMNRDLLELAGHKPW